MKAHARWEEIVRLAAQEKYVWAGELADRFSVSVHTIRHDLDRLARSGLLLRTHGGARRIEGAAGDASSTARREEVSQAIARRLPATGTVYLDSALGGGILRFWPATSCQVITGDIRLLNAIPARFSGRLYFTGMACYRGVADDGLAATFLDAWTGGIDACVMDVDDIDEHGGALVASLAVAAVKKRVLRRCRQVFWVNRRRGGLVRLAGGHAVYDLAPGAPVAREEIR